MGLQYQLQTSFGTFTSLTQASYLDSFVFQGTIESRGLELAGFSANSSTLGDGYLKWKGISRLDWAWKGFDLVGTARYTGGYHEKLLGSEFTANGQLKEHYVKQTWFFDAQLSYDFTFATPVAANSAVPGYSKDAKEVVRGKDGKAVESTETANYSMPCWKNLVNNTTITVGCNNVFGQDPPVQKGAFGASNANNFPGAIYDNVGRFVYAELTKKF